MAGNNFYVNLSFKANAKEALANLDSLRNKLNEIASKPLVIGGNVSQNLKDAANSASELQKHLNNAINTKTGNLDLSKLNSSLASSNQSLSGLTSNLLKAGVAGEQAFLGTYSAIAQANIQLTKSNSLVSRFTQTLANTVRWQFSSSIVNNITNAFSSALDYAKELNTSLNNIQIVTGYSADYMADFAKQANKAAKELKTTTTAYSDAALIYYQQGLEGDAVTKRADTTVKLANVTGESAQKVSQWMTSVWNNFDDGSRKLEYYADVMAALGAATASSSDEIAEGLEKFSAVAETVGLSYEYATAALATVTAQTRQSADVVGTAFKTLFARIQDLELGETLDDGTTLGTYSEALLKAGVNIKDQTGGLKDMNVILDEMGAKWQTLNKDQQVALAKSVAGVRQYTQLIALMDNYDYFQQNVGVATDAEGTLEEQSKIYQESWEAATKNVKASMEELYSTLIPTDTIVDLTNGLATVVSGFTKVLDAAGGLKTILLLIATTVLSKFQGSIANAIDTGISKFTSFKNNVKDLGANVDKTGNKIKTSFKDRVKNVTGLSGESEVRQRQSVLDDPKRNAFQTEYRKGLDKAAKVSPLTAGFQSQIKSLQTIDDYNVRILNLKEKMTSAEFESFKLQQQQAKELGKELAQHKQKKSDLENELETMKLQAQLTSDAEVKSNFTEKTGRYTQQSVQTAKDVGLTKKMAAEYSRKINETLGKESLGVQLPGGNLNIKDLETAKAAQAEILGIISDTAQAYHTISNAQNLIDEQNDKWKEDLINLVKNEEAFKSLTEGQVKAIEDAVTDSHNLDEAITQVKAKLSEASGNAAKMGQLLGVSDDKIKSAAANGIQLSDAMLKVKQTSGQQKKLFDDMSSKLKDIVNRAASLGTTITQGLQGISQMAMGWNMVSSAWESLTQAFKDGESDWGAAISAIGSLAMGLPMLIGGFTVLVKLVQSSAIAYNLSSAAMAKQITSSQILTNQIQLKNLAEKTSIDQTKIETFLTAIANGEKFKQALVTAGLTKEQGKLILSQMGLNAGLLTSIGLILTFVAIIAAAILIIVGITNAISDWYNADKNAAEAAKKHAETSKKQYEELKKSIEEVKSALESYEKSYEALSKLTKGTEEWQNAVTALNREVLDLLDKYPELAKYVKNINGVLTIDTENIDYGEDGLTAVEIAKNNADIKAKEAQYKSDVTDMVRAVDTASVNETEIRSAYSQLEQKFNEQGEALFNPEDWKKIVKEIVGDDEDLYNILTDSGKGRIQTALRSYGTLQSNTNVSNQANAISLLNKNDYEGSMSNRMLELAEQDQKEATKKIRETYGNATSTFRSGSGMFGYGGTEAGLGAWHRYKNNKKLKLKKAPDFEADGIRYTTEDGTKQFLSYSDLADEVASYDVTEGQGEQITAQAEERNDIITNLANSNDYRDQALAYYLEHGNFDGLDPEIAKHVQSFNSANLSADDAKEFGFKNITDFQRSIKNSYRNYDVNQARKNVKEQREERGNQIIQSTAEDLEIDSAILEAYTEKLMSNSSALRDNKEAAAELAAEHYKMAKGISSLSDTYNEYSTILAQGPQAGMKYYEALGKMKNTLKENFGVDVSTDFLERDDVKRALAGTAAKDTKSYKDLQILLGSEYTAGLEMGSDQAASNLAKGLEELANKAKNLGENETLNIDENLLKDLDQQLQKGEITSEQIAKLFNYYGFNPPPIYTDPNGKQYLIQPEETDDEQFEYIDYATWDPEVKTYKTNRSYDGGNGNFQFTTVTVDGTEVTTSLPTSEKGIGLTTSDKFSNGLIDSMMEMTNTETKEEKEERLEELEKSIDRYHELERIIEDNERALSRLGKEKDNVYGKNKLKYIDEEIKKHQENIKIQKELMAAAKERAATDQKALINSYGADIINGKLINYEEIEEQLVEELKKIADTESSDYKKAENRLERFRNLASGYEEAHQKFQDAQDSIRDSELAKEAAKLEKITSALETNLELTEISLESIDHQLQKIEDDAFAAADKIKLIGQQAELSATNMESHTKAIKDLLSNAGFSEEEYNNLISGNVDLNSLLQNKEFTPDEFKALQESMSALYEEAANIEELKENAGQAVIDYAEKWREEMEWQTSGLQHSKEILESYKNIVDIVGKDSLGFDDNFLKEMSNLNQQMANNEIAIARLNAESAKQREEDGKRLFEQGAITEEQYRTLVEEAREMDLALQESWTNALQVAADEFENSVQRIMDAYDKALGNLEEKTAWFEKQQTLQDFFLKDYEKTYEISKLNRKISESIDSNDNVAAQRKLRDIQSELLDYQRQGKNMSDYDLQYLQKKYDLTVAQNALEDAQNAKSQARLTRDSSGNFGYVYTANQKNVESAQQQFEDKLYAMEEFLDKSQSDLSKQWFDLNKQWQDEMAALDKNAEDYAQKAADITAYYTELMNNVSGEMEDMMIYGKELNENYGTHAAETFHETLIGKMFVDYSTFKEMQVKTSAAMQTALTELTNSHITFKDSTTPILNEYKTKYTDTMSEAKKANDELLNNVNALDTKMKSGWNDVLTETKAFATKYNGILNPLKETTEALATAISKLLVAYGNLPSKEDIKGYQDLTNNDINPGFDPKKATYSIYGKSGDGTYTLRNAKGEISSGYELTDLGYKNSDLYNGALLGGTSVNITNSSNGSQWTAPKFSGSNSQQNTNNSDNSGNFTNDGKQNNDKKQYKITGIYQGSQYDLYEVNGKKYPKDDLIFVNGNENVGGLIELRDDAINEEFDTNISLGEMGISFDKENSWRVREYDGNQEKGLIIDIAYPTSQAKDEDVLAKQNKTQLENLNKFKIKGIKNNLYEFDQYYDYKQDGTRSGDGFLFEYKTKWINNTDLTQLLNDPSVLNKYNFQKFDTGGYTGSWGPEGRMAMLHQKEIVLNAHDTENFLTAIQIVRSIADKLETNTILAAQGLGNLVAAAAVNNNREVLEQNVTIHAEFPNATDHNEIELAFNDLINQASQYVNRR